MKGFQFAIGLALVVGGCASGYSLVPPQTVAVANGKFRVTPSQAWNRAPKGARDIAEEENWTANGPALDNISFIGALADGKAIVKQRQKADQKVPIFRADMTPQDLTSMVESFYRIRTGAAVFEPTGVAPATLLGHPGLQFDYEYVGGDEVKRRGRTVGAIIDKHLYLIVLDGTKLHYFDAALPEFDRLVASARL